MTRETIFAALFAKLNISGLNTRSRILKHWADVPSSSQPALYMAKGSESVQQVTGQPSRVTMDAKVWVYAYSTDPSVSPSSPLNAILDGIMAAVAPTPGPQNKQTLGGLVEHCWIDGEIITDEGSLGEQAVAQINIKMLTTT